jgi:hypothetical protein
MALPLAPIVSQLLTNGLGLIANAVMAKGKDYVEKKFDVKLTPEMTSEDLTRLQMAQMEHEEELLRIKLEDNKLDLAKYELSLKDTGNARKREIEIATAENAPLLNKVITPILALAIIGITMGLFSMVMFDNTPVEPSRKDILIYVLGVLSAVSTQVASYYFGSSSSSKEKTDALKEAIK